MSELTLLAGGGAKRGVRRRCDDATSGWAREQRPAHAWFRFRRKSLPLPPVAQGRDGVLLLIVSIRLFLLSRSFLSYRVSSPNSHGLVRWHPPRLVCPWERREEAVDLNLPRYRGAGRPTSVSVCANLRPTQRRASVRRRKSVACSPSPLPRLGPAALFTMMTLDPKVSYLACRQLCCALQ